MLPPLNFPAHPKASAVSYLATSEVSASLSNSHRILDALARHTMVSCAHALEMRSTEAEFSATPLSFGISTAHAALALQSLTYVVLTMVCHGLMSAGFLLLLRAPPPRVDGTQRRRHHQQSEHQTPHVDRSGDLGEVSPFRSVRPGGAPQEVSCQAGRSALSG